MYPAADGSGVMGEGGGCGSVVDVLLAVVVVPAPPDMRVGKGKNVSFDVPSLNTNSFLSHPFFRGGLAVNVLTPFGLL